MTEPEKPRGSRRKPRVRLLMLGVMVVVIAACVWLFGSWNEPAFEGRSLSSWLRQLNNPEPGTGARMEAVAALRSMGTNVIPVLLRGLDESDETRLARLQRYAQEHWGLRYQLPTHLAQTSAGQLQVALVAMDPPTQDAVVRALLAEYVRRWVDTSESGDFEMPLRRIRACFAGLNEAFLPVLREALTNAEPEVRMTAASLVLQPGVPADFLPLLIERASDSDARVRYYALVSLLRFPEHGASVIPVLTAALHDQEQMVRVAALQCLAQCGTEAASAIPDVKALVEENQALHQIAEDTLQKITPPEPPQPVPPAEPDR